MSGLTLAAAASTLDLTGANLTYVVRGRGHRAGGAGLRRRAAQQRAGRRPGHREDAEIAGAVQEGASAYLTRQFRTLAVFVVLAFVLLFLLPADTDVDPRSAGRVFFVVGAVFSAFIGYAGMGLATRANVRVAAPPARPTARRSRRCRSRSAPAASSASSPSASACSAPPPSCCIYEGDAPTVLEGFGFGAALLAMFMRVGGGIFTKAADVGADLVGKVEQGIPEDDPRNAATIADNVGDNVGDCAGMAADLFESYAVTLVAALILGKAAFGEDGLVFPLIVPAIGVLTAIIGVFITRLRPDRPQRHEGDQPGLLHLGRDLGRARARSPRSSTCRRTFAELAGVDRTIVATPATATRGCSRSARSSSASCSPRSSSR